jgi:isocitrate dehydrogenase kinase/phosphatase
MTPAQERVARAIKDRFPALNVDPFEVARIAIETLYDLPRRGDRHGRAKLTLQQVEEIRQRRANREKVEALGAEYGVCASHIAKIEKRKAWR